MENTQFEFITSNPTILNGKPIIKDTRISVDMILEWIGTCATVKDIISTYTHLQEVAVRQAILYALYLIRNEIIIQIPLNCCY